MFTLFRKARPCQATSWSDNSLLNFDTQKIIATHSTAIDNFLYFFWESQKYLFIQHNIYRVLKTHMAGDTIYVNLNTKPDVKKKNELTIDCISKDN